MIDLINIGVFLLWVAVLATALLRAPQHCDRNGPTESGRIKPELNGGRRSGPAL
jgi:hypothetical protein